jgi:predicted dehydrogenase
MIRTSFCYCTNRIEGNIRFSGEMFGGALMDVGCYCLSFSRLFAGADPVSMTVAGRMHLSGVDEMACGNLVYPGGILASFSCAMTAAADNTAYLCGTGGFLEIPVPWKPPVGQARYVLRQGTPPRMQLNGKAPSPVPARVVSVPAERDLYAYEADDFAAAVLDGTPMRVTAEETLAIARQLDELRRQVGIR